MRPFHQRYQRNQRKICGCVSTGEVFRQRCEAKISEVDALHESPEETKNGVVGVVGVVRAGLASGGDNTNNASQETGDYLKTERCVRNLI